MNSEEIPFENFIKCFSNKKERERKEKKVSQTVRSTNQLLENSSTPIFP